MLRATIPNPISRRLLLEAELQPGMRVLDIGCGSGHPGTAFHEAEA